MFEIIINYDSGDSFNTYKNQETSVGSWNSKDIAIENISYIKEQYEIYNRTSSNYFGDNSLSEDEAVEIIKTKIWCPIRAEKGERSGWNNNYGMLHSINLKLDNGNWMRFGTSTWEGYFETLNSVKIK